MKKNPKTATFHQYNDMNFTDNDIPEKKPVLDKKLVYNIECQQCAFKMFKGQSGMKEK